MRRVRAEWPGCLLLLSATAAGQWVTIGPVSVGPEGVKVSPPTVENTLPVFVPSIPATQAGVGAIGGLAGAAETIKNNPLIVLVPSGVSTTLGAGALGGASEAGRGGLKSTNPLEELKRSYEKGKETGRNILGAPLAVAIRDAKQRALQNAEPMPDHTVRALRAFYSAAVVPGTRMSCEWGAAANGTLQQFLLGNGYADAVTLDDVVVFRDCTLAKAKTEEAFHLWAHELRHVQ